MNATKKSKQGASLGGGSFVAGRVGDPIDHAPRGRDEAGAQKRGAHALVSDIEARDCRKQAADRDDQGNRASLGTFFRDAAAFHDL